MSAFPRLFPVSIPLRLNALVTMASFSSLWALCGTLYVTSILRIKTILIEMLRYMPINSVHYNLDVVVRVFKNRYFWYKRPMYEYF